MKSQLTKLVENYLSTVGIAVDYTNFDLVDPEDHPGAEPLSDGHRFPFVWGGQAIKRNDYPIKPFPIFVGLDMDGYFTIIYP